ncbi:MAG: hypothetical protein FWC96_09460 [Oscillospiraceae bacterium]|nr:hypothetical protein [Oscillospiraceae bacterium]
MKKKKTKLQYIQLRPLMHLAQYETLDYLSCLRFLDVDNTNDRTALSYLFRPLTKNDYVAKHKDGSVTILAKGRALFPHFKPLVTLGGGAAGRARVNTVSKIAMFMNMVDVESVASPDEWDEACFIPSACWRKIRPGILSTARFSGMLFVGKRRLAVYDIGDGNMEWQLRAEGSLFYRNHGDYETRATGMLFICDDDKRLEVAERIIRMTMWQRKQLTGRESTHERDKPVQYARAPIRLKAQYEHVYLATPASLSEIIGAIYEEEAHTAEYQGDNAKINDPAEGDYEAWPQRCFINTASDLLKYVYFFAAAKELMQLRKRRATELNYAIILPERDFPILNMYPDVAEMEGLEVIKHYEY